MSQPPPPPPPPHGENPKTTAGSGLPPGKYDIFIIPEHSAGGGFLYLPSLQPNINSFVAGFASALAIVVLGQSMAPALRVWWNGFQGMGNMGVVLLLVAVGLGAWSLGRQHQDGPGGQGSGTGSTGDSGSGAFGGGGGAGTSSAPPPNAGPPPSSPPPQPETPGGNKPGSSWGTPRPPPSGTARAENNTPKGAWEKAREETRRREEERKAKEAEQKRREEAARRLRELREKEAREREQREREAREREQREKEAREREQKEREAREREQREKEAREREARERERERKEREAREAKEKEERERQAAREREARENERRRREEEERNTRKGSTYAYSGVGERINPWPNGRPSATSSQPASPSPAKAAPPPSPSTPTKKPPAPTAKTDLGTEEETYSYRPYDKPKRPARRKSFSEASESSWAPSQSTARTTPPPSARAPYTTKDPDKIVIKAVYGFVNQFAKTPASQLVSGVGTVTDGLILRITTEGLFIDDDVRGVAQREWDVKAWTLKLVETGEWKTKGLHLLRATIRDQEGKRFLFVISDEESWKVAVGLQRLRRGTQVRALGVAGLSGLETRSTLEMLGWG